eukprot:13794150-Ditylum_brightwellii.AAC.1
MIAQGTTAISHGSLSEGVMTGEQMLSFVPLHLSAREVSPNLECLIKPWAPRETEFITPEGWYERRHDIDGRAYYTDSLWYPCIQPGVFVWDPLPTAAIAAIEEL